jgi:hypothetical protein
MYKVGIMQSDQCPGVEFLAKESHESINDVARPYENEMANLEVGARIKGLLPIFARRNARDLLLHSNALTTLFDMLVNATTKTDTSRQQSSVVELGCGIAHFCVDWPPHFRYPTSLY